MSGTNDSSSSWPGRAQRETRPSTSCSVAKTWMPGSSPGMTTERAWPRVESGQKKTRPARPGLSQEKALMGRSEPSGRDLGLVVGGLAQHIAAAPDSLDIVLAARRIRQLLAQLADEHVDDLQLGLVHAAIEMIEEHLLGQRRALAQRKQLEHLIFLAGQMHARAVDLHRLGVEVDDEIAGVDDGLGMALGAPHDRVDARHQFVLVEWLGHVVVGAEAETAHLVLDAGEAGEDQDRRLHFRDAQAAQNLETRHVGQ